MCIYPFSFNNVKGKLQQLVRVVKHVYIKAYFIDVCVLTQELGLEPSEKKEVAVQFDPSYCRDRHSRTEDNQLVVAYREHPLRVRSLYVYQRTKSIIALPLT